MKRVWLTWLLCTACAAGSPDTKPIQVRIPPGATVRSVADSLHAHSLIRSTTVFRIRARLAHADRALKPGLYEFASNASTGDILDRIKRGDAVHFRLTLPPGGTIFDLARATQDRFGIPRDSVLRAASDAALLRDLRVRARSVEGWLLPETFDFGAFATSQEILKRFVAARLAAWDTTWDARAKEAGLDRAGLLTLASIVEAEAIHPEERPTIAAVYRNRLRIGMALQADPTIQYGYLVRDGQRKERLYNKDYDMVSPWNTYHFTGLPPGPIGNPSREAIEAVLSPAPVKYLYFVAGSDGVSHFSLDLAGQQREIRKIRKP